MDENNQVEVNQLEERMKNLVGGKKEAEAKAESEAKARQESDAKAASLEKERDFYSSFSDSIAKYPSAPEYKDKIKEKVMAGYSVEDATISILHAEGKLTPSAPQKENVTGGSAPTQITNQGSKTVQEMNSNERWDALREAERRGDISLQ